MGKQKRSKDSGQPTSGGRPVVGLACIALGLLPILWPTDLESMSPGDTRVPSWVLMVSGAIFVVTGLMLMVGERRVEGGALGPLAIFLFMATFAVVFNWIAFGSGERTCDDGSAGWMCRGVFGMGALMVDIALAWYVGAGVRRLFRKSSPSR